MKGHRRPDGFRNGTEAGLGKRPGNDWPTLCNHLEATQAEKVTRLAVLPCEGEGLALRGPTIGLPRGRKCRERGLETRLLSKEPEG